MSRQIRPRIVIVIRGGMVEDVHYEGLDDLALGHHVIVDYDCDDDDNPRIAGERAAVTIDAPTPMPDRIGRDVAREWAKWEAE